MTDITHNQIVFDDRHMAQAIQVAPDVDPRAALDALDLPPYNGVIVMHGGAGNMTPAQIDAVRRFLTAGLAPFAEERRILVIDGGTRSGAMLAMGDARQAVSGTYPLLGVVPHKFVGYPGGPALDSGRFPLDPSHSHFLLVSGDQFGVESELLVGLLQASGKPGLALVINGGTIVLQEVQKHAALGNTVITVRGSGRTADDLADPGGEARVSLLPGARLEVANMDAPGAFRVMLARLLPGTA
ncbi:MAG: hypothetical protein JW966_01250 [Anaerolineae bacterium]|nr:hypothetical protein [Anaerolineae bacterium]